MADKQMTIRLDDDLAFDFDVVCKILGKSMNEVIQELVRKHVESSKADPDFRKRLGIYIDRLKGLR